MMRDLKWLSLHVKERTGQDFDPDQLVAILEHLVTTYMIPKRRTEDWQFAGTIDIRVKMLVHFLSSPEGRKEAGVIAHVPERYVLGVDQEAPKPRRKRKPKTDVG